MDIVPWSKAPAPIFTAVCKVLKHAQMVSDVLEQLDGVITFDVAIFIQAKKIEIKFSEEF